MPRLLIEDIIVISYDYTSRDKYWNALSQHLIEKHGNQHFTEHAKVEKILLDGLQFLIAEFRKLILSEKSYTFFLYIFWLHEESIKLFVKSYKEWKSEEIDEDEFAMYRRVLKLVLEQGCDVDLEKGEFPDAAAMKRMDGKIQELYYLGTWIYGFADFIAFQKMIEEAYDVKFDEKNSLIVNWQHHYGAVYHKLFPMLRDDYSKGAFDEEAVHELKKALEKCFGIDYDFAGGVIFQIKKHHNPSSPHLVSIQPDILAKNLIHQSGITLDPAEIFYAGLTLSRQNKLSIEEVVYKPYSTERYLYRPILIYNIGGEERALVGIEKFAEAMYVLSTNAVQWNALQKEWKTLKCMQAYLNRKSSEHDKILEDKIEEIIISKGFYYCRNIKTFKQLSGTNIRIDNENCGEIDFIILNIKLKKVFITDAKYNRTRYEGVGFRNDYSNFIDSYEPQLQKKIKWIKENLIILQEHLKIANNDTELDLTDFEVEGIFLINTPTFYMFNGNYKAITLKQVSDFIEGEYEYPALTIVDENGNTIMVVQHPYFRKPIILTGLDV